VEAVTVKPVAERSTAKSCPSAKARSSTERAATKPAAASEACSASEAAPAAKPAATVEATSAVKSSTAVGSASTMEAASTAMGSTAAMAAATLSERQRGHTKNHKGKNCNENYRQDLLHFRPSNSTTQDCLAGTNFRRGNLRWQSTYRPILHPRRASSQTSPNANRDERMDDNEEPTRKTGEWGTRQKTVASDEWRAKKKQISHFVRDDAH
jgi:hypothetical protein